MTAKVFNEKHEVAITVDLAPIDNSLDKKLEDMVDCSQKVYQLYFHHQVEAGRYVRIYLNRSFIMDLYDQIKDIEGKTVSARYDEDIF